MSGIYIHIPFCRQACHYCNFHFSTSLALKSEMVNAIEKEINLTPFYENVPTKISTIYFGGGTPGILSIDELKQLNDALHKKFEIASNAEITLEANPDDISKATLDSWLSIGINRLSVGIQSFSDAELVWMNRAHDAADAINCIQLIKSSGFTDFSIDLIYGSPLLSNDQWKKNVSLVADLAIPHISCYALTVEPATALHKMIQQFKKEPVDAEKQAAHFLMLMDWMTAAGYEHYEISNFAKPGMRSKHNSSYWQGASYYGFGPAAHSFNGAGIRKWNVANNSLYIQSIKNNIIPFEQEKLTANQQLNEYIMTALRTSEGINLQKIKTAYGGQTIDRIAAIAKKWSTNKVIVTEHHVLLTKEGKLFADGIAADLFI